MADDLPPGFSVVQQPATADLPPGFSVVGQQAPSSTLGDTAKSFGSGVVRGAVEGVMLPITAKRLMEGGVNAGLDGLENVVRWAFGGSGPSPQDTAARAAAQANNPVATMDAPLNAAQDVVRGVMDRNLHAPETLPGRYAETIGEFVGPGGVPGKAVRAAPTAARKIAAAAGDAVGNILVPAITSQAAGEATNGTAAEPWARFLGALFGNGVTAAGRAWNAPEAMIRRSTGDVAPAQWAEAERLMNNPTGIKLTGPEAIAQATDGATALPNLMRVVEGSPEGRTASAPFFAARPGQVDTAVGNVLNRIAPQDAAPSSLGLRMQQAASKAMTETPEGQALTDAIFGVGPRTTPLQAGEVIQPALRDVYDRREGMRNALADRDYQAARTADPSIPVAGLQPETTVRRPEYTSIRPTGPEGEAPNAMTPQVVPAQTEVPAMTSRTGGEQIQVDARPVVQFIDKMIPDARATTQDALNRVRGMLFDRGGVDTSINGLDAARGQIGDMINVAKREGNMQTADALLKVQQQLDGALGTVPEYASARQGFQNASRPLDPFQSPGMAKAITRDEFNNRFVTPPEDVPGALASPAEARNFNTVAPDAARTAFGNHLATQILDKATDANGAVSADRLALALRDNADLLSQYPDVAQRLQAVVQADAGLATRRAGSLGKMANSTETATAANTLLPHDPMSGAAGETGDLVRLLMGQDPQATAATVRQNLGDRYAKSSTATMEGNREFGGAKFRKDIAGNAPRQEVLDAVLGQLPGAPNVDMNDLLQVLEATGRRKPIGSATAFNEGIKSELGAASPLSAALDVARTAGVSWLTKAGDATKRAALRGNVRTLADMFTDPRSVELIRNAANRGAPVNFAEALARAAAEGAITGR